MRSRSIVVTASILFTGMMGYVYVLSALPPTFVMGITAGMYSGDNAFGTDISKASGLDHE